MDRLSGLDASFLYLETPAQLMHVCGLMVIDPSTVPGGYSYDSLRERVRQNVVDVPEFTRRLRRVPLDLDHPVWVNDDHFKIDHHLHRMSLPAPGGYAELVDLCGHLAGQTMNRSRPLWEMWVIEGYGDQIVILLKMHHATVDGASGSNLLSHLCSLEADQPPVEVSEPLKAERAPGGLELFGRGVFNTITRPFTVGRLLQPSLGLVSKSISRAQKGTAMAAPFSAPRTSFNGTITSYRSIGLVDLDLGDIKAVKDQAGATINDVVLTLAGGALRSYLDKRGELPDTSLVATVPVSVHSASHRENGVNKVSAFFARLGTDIEDPLERLEMMALSNSNAKAHNKAVSADALQDWAEFAAPRTFGLAMRTYASLRLAEKHPVVHNLVISNVPGPPFPLYFAGARIDGMYALGPVFHGAGLNITVMSNNGRVNIGIIACSEAMKGVEELATEFPAELKRIQEAIAATV